MVLRTLFGLALFVSMGADLVQAASPKQNLLLQCLAKEEERLHKKGPPDALFRLNQEFINELASANDITVKREYINEICAGKKHSPSVGLLRLLLLKENEVYDLSLSGVDPSMRPFKMAYINEFNKQVPRLFISYIAGIQSEMATPDCLEKAIPELVSFNEKLKFLEEEMSTHQIIHQKTKLAPVFTKLEKISEIKARCEKQAERSAKVKKKKNARL